MDTKRKRLKSKSTNQSYQNLNNCECFNSSDSIFRNRNKEINSSNGWIDERVFQNRMNYKRNKPARRKLYKNFEEYVNNKYRTRISSSEHDLKQEQNLWNNLRIKYNTSDNLNFLKHSMMKHSDFETEGEVITSHKISRCYSEGNQVIYEEYTVKSSHQNQLRFDNASNIFKAFKRTLIQYTDKNNVSELSDDEYHNENGLKCSKKCSNIRSLKLINDNNLNMNLSSKNKSNYQTGKSKVFEQSPPSITSSDADDLFEDAVDRSKSYIIYDRNTNDSSLDFEDKTDVSFNSLTNSDRPTISSSISNSTFNTLNVNCSPSYDKSLTLTTYSDDSIETPASVPWRRIFPNFKSHLHYPYREIWWMSSALVDICKKGQL